MTLTCWDMADQAVEAGAPRVLLYGLKGIAKSRYALDMLRKSHNLVRQCSCNEDYAVQELQGHYIPKGVFEWHDGPVMDAYRNGGGLVVNELGRASGAMQDFFLSVLDDPSVSMISLPNGENVKPGKGFQTIATSNSSPEAMDEALRDRFDAIIEIDRPHPKLIDYLNGKVKGLGTVIERSYQDKNHTISPRRGLAYIYFRGHGCDVDVAATLAFGAKAKDILVAISAVEKARKRQ